ncbi:hypothetical protein KC571_01705, partial [candidate division WWE3 bacterium]|nr:hypothetical protein [candidate division WWE3 bacterium]
YNPDIFGLEKYMDYGFILSILRSDYFPPLDHYFAGETINYYYFGHHMIATLTRLSQVPANITFNLQVALIFALTFMSSFSVTATFIYHGLKKSISQRTLLIGGGIGGLFTAVVGNLHAALNILDYKDYWYASASRLIPFTINEFPVYSFVVADLHGHVNNLPIVLLIVAAVTQMALSLGDKISDNEEIGWKNIFSFPYAILILALGSSYATNSWDFAIYHLLIGFVTLYFVYRYYQKTITHWGSLLLTVLETTSIIIAPLFISSILVFLPFWRTVVPIGKGIGKVYTYSPISLVLVLWGLFFFLSISFICFAFRGVISSKIRTIFGGKESRLQKIIHALTSPEDAGSANLKLEPSDLLALIMFATAFLLIIIPEIIYVKDIYPQHYRANTMFKLYYGAWILFSISTAYSFVRMVTMIKRGLKSNFWITNVLLQYVLIAATMLYPYLAINTTTNSFKTYEGLDGTTYLDSKLPYDAMAIDWINENISGQPTFLEAVGDSYTEFARIAANTGIPAVMGWPVHEWLWRGTWDQPVQPTSHVQEESGETDTVAQRVVDVETMYTSTDKNLVLSLLDKYHVDYIYLGQLEKEKYPELNAELLVQLGEVIYSNDKVNIIKYSGSSL